MGNRVGVRIKKTTCQISKLSYHVANFYTKFELFINKKFTEAIRYQHITGFFKNHPTRRDALAINVNRDTGLFGRSADTSAVRINGNLRPSGNFSTKRRTWPARRTPASIFSHFQRDFRGRFYYLQENSFLADFLFVCQRLALLQKLVNPEWFVLLQMCQTGAGQKI